MRVSRFFATTFAAFFAALTLWSFASPLLSSPDEPAHIVRAAAVVRGQILPDRDSNNLPTIMVKVPAYIVPKDGLCFAGDPNISAECQSSVWPSSTALADLGTSASSNNPIYYLAMGLPTLFLDNAPALYAMRILNAALVAALLAVAVTAVRLQAATATGATLALVALTPTALFLGGSVNPNSVEMAAAGALLGSALLLIRNQVSRGQAWLWSGAAGASAIFLLSGRSVALLWVLMIFLVIVAVVGLRPLASAIRTGPVAVAAGVTAVASVWMLVWTRIAIPAIIDPAAGITPLTPGTVFLIQFQNSISQIDAWIGAFGWLDFHAPSGVLFIYHTIIGATVLLAFAVSRARIRAALAIGIVGVLFIPSAIQVSLYDDVGWMWQGRYLLSLFFVIAITAGIGVDQTIGRSPETFQRYIRPMVRAGAVIVAVAQTAAFSHVMRRYVVGDDLGWPEMILRPEWQPPGGSLTLIALYAALMAAGVVMVWRFTSTARSSFPVQLSDEFGAATAESGAFTSRA